MDIREALDTLKTQHPELAAQIDQQWTEKRITKHIATVAANTAKEEEAAAQVPQPE